jgi:xanthine dehydrogenase molybdopterin binding subunit/xanthine dehydrogenase small subunit
MHAPRELRGETADTFQLTVNGRLYHVRNERPDRMLLDWLRANGLTGTKLGCGEGDCGACTVAVVERDAHGCPAYRAVNSCIALLPTFAGREVITIEGLERDGKLHPAQECMVRHGGSQCGYCTPGFVMSLFEALHRREPMDQARIADQLCGNLCRCTGYRPIREAAVELLCGDQIDTFGARLEQEVAPVGEYEYETGNLRFFRPDSMERLFELRALHPGARLVAGATEIAVEINKKGLEVATLLALDGIEDLRRCEATDAAWHLGGAATLTQIEETLAGEYPMLDRMLRLFASRQIRNRATLGGNLVTASPIGDSAPALLALGASVVLASSAGQRTVPLDEFFTGYRQTVLREDEVLTAIIVPRAGSGNRKTQFYKVSKRGEMDISIVAAGFYIEFDESGVVTAARMAFGGVAPMPVRAREAETLLVGRGLDAAAIEAVTDALANAFQPISDARGSAGFRGAVVTELWRKFCRSEAWENEWEFEPSAWEQAVDASRAFAHESAVAHVTGRAAYVDDVAQRRRMLTMWPVMSPHAHARLVKLDVSAALAMPGIRGVLTASDVPGVNDVGVSRFDECLFATDEVQYQGHLLAVVVGESEMVCRRAAACVIAEYEPLPAVLTLREAIEAESFHTDPNFMRRGDASDALAASPLRIEGEFELGGQEHFYLETHAAWAEVTTEGDIHVASSTQHPSEIQTIVSRVLGVPRNRVTVEAPRMGGGFGGKETQGNTFAALAALAAWKIGGPVRVQLDRDVDMMLTGKRHPFLARFKVGFGADGVLQAAQIALFSNGGWSLDLSMPVTDRAMFHTDNAYYIPNFEVSGRVAKTNLASNTAFRGFGGPQGMLVIEEIMERVARETVLPPEVVRERNFYHGEGETNTTHYGQEIGDSRLGTIWQRLKVQADFESRRKEIAAWNAGHDKAKRGLAMTPVKFGISFTFTPFNQAGALVLIYEDGTAQVNHGGTEMGQGLHAKILGVAMREFGLDAGRIRMMHTRTDKVPNTSATAASSGADLNGAAVRNACLMLKERLEGVLARALETERGGAVTWRGGEVWFEADPDRRVTFRDLAARAITERVSLAATGFHRTPEIYWSRADGRGRPFYYFACGAAVSEVEVDGFTGAYRVRRVDILHDVGESLNPSVDRGQIEGGFVQGMGWLTREELLWDLEGRLLTHSASMYQIPAFSDAPMDFRVQLLDAGPQPGVVHGSKAVGEPPLMLAISVREAIRDAVAAFGTSGGQVALPSPATGEAVFWAIQERLRDR